MSQPRYFGPDPTQMRLSATLATHTQGISRALTGLPEDLARPVRESLAALTEQLALPPVPDLRTCPQCHTVGMRNATICGNCWTHLEALSSLAPS